MSYTTITGLITMGLLLLVLFLAVFPTPGVFMVVSALVPVGIAMVALKVLRAPEKVIERKDDFPWYDSH
jgi:hypothetical protein